ncbi:MAG: CopG family ribbon-helix-helix protein [Tepidiformaceae bacterium]
MRSVHTIALSKRTERVSISLPSELLHSFDALLVEDREGRSGAIRRLIESALREAREREDVERWIESYRNDPQDEEELAWSEAVAADSLRRVAWK